eukprot:4088081-Pyramimonas_sp.AAC.1
MKVQTAVHRRLLCEDFGEVAAGNLKELNSESSGINVEAVVLDGPTANAGGAMAPVPMVPPEAKANANNDG